MKIWYIWTCATINNLSGGALYLDFTNDIIDDTMTKVTVAGIAWFQKKYGANHRDNCLNPRTCVSFHADGHMKTIRSRCPMSRSHVVFVPELHRHVSHISKYHVYVHV